MSPDKTITCPRCGGNAHQRISWLKAAAGFALVIVGFVLFIATFGASFVLSIFGVFMMMPSARCKACGWRESEDQ